MRRIFISVDCPVLSETLIDLLSSAQLQNMSAQNEY
jgi:hypothetical protein